MPSERILICGAGVAGSVLAYWLAKHDFQVVVVERSKSEQKAGQGIEIELPALNVVKAMGIVDKLNEKKTAEKGFTLIDEHGHSYGLLEAGGLSPTGALELMRGDLTEVLYETANQSANVTYQFETVIQSLRQTQDKVIVNLRNRSDQSTTTEEFDLVVGADGARSRTRQLVMGPPEELKCFKPVHACVAYFSIPKEDRDMPYSRLCHFPGRRIIWTRPVAEDSDVTSIYLIHAGDDVPNLSEANSSGDRLKQKQALAELYRGLGGDAPRVIEQMKGAQNFYSEDLMQVKLQKWSQNRVVFVGDSAWAPTPFTGQGNQLAIIGAWVLAQELSRNRNQAAFETYEKRLRSYVESSQKIPGWGYAPFIFNPQTTWGIWIFRTVFRLVASAINLLSPLISRWMPEDNQRPHDDFDLQMKTEEIK